RIEYLAKRRALLLKNVHLVELDLLFGGRRLPLQQSLPPADYYYLLSRGDQRPDCQVYRWTLGSPCPHYPSHCARPMPISILIWRRSSPPLTNGDAFSAGSITRCLCRRSCARTIDGSVRRLHGSGDTAPLPGRGSESCPAKANPR